MVTTLSQATVAGLRCHLLIILAVVCDGAVTTEVGARFGDSVTSMWEVSRPSKGGRNNAVVEGGWSAVATVIGVSAGILYVTSCCCGM